MSEPTASPQSLGAIEISDKTFVHDVVISDRYQTFSAELLRLSLLGITAIGFLIVNILLKDQLVVVHRQVFVGFLTASLLCLGLSSAGALFHRWLSSDSLAEHLLLLRLETRHAQGDADLVIASKGKRRKQFKRAGLSLCFRAFFSGLAHFVLLFHLSWDSSIAWAQHNKSLDASGGSVFRNLAWCAKGALIRAAASTQPFDAISN